MKKNETIIINCIEVIQPIGQFYIATMTWQDILQISWADIRRISEMDNYLGIQREIDQSRVEQIGKYVKTVDATFPTAIILAVSSDDVVDYKKEEGVLVLRNDENVAKIIDGQHRIEGLKALTDTDIRFDLNVTIFIDMDIEDVAMVFATINLAQTRVRKSLAYDLFEFTKARSPQKTAHNIAKLLNSKEFSPLKNRIKILGTATRKFQTLTQAAFVEALLILISGSLDQAREDRDLIKRVKPLPLLNDKDARIAVFRKLFEADEDAVIAKVVWNYFSAISMRWPEAWNDVRLGGSMLPRTNGFRAFMRYFPLAYDYLGASAKIQKEEDFLNLFQRISLKDDQFNTNRYKPGSTGERALLDDLISMSGL